MSTTDLDTIRGQQSRSLSPDTVHGFINSMKGELQRALPKGMDADRMARLVLTTVRKTPKLALCTTASFGGALLTATALGLEPDVNGECYLIPHENRREGIVECTLVIGYQGFVRLFWQSPLAKHIDAQAVYENDTFSYAYGLDPFLTHIPVMKDRGDVIAYYAVASLTNGAKAFVVLSPEDCKALRGGKVGPDVRFKGGDPMKWMERKTAVRQLVKLLPKSVMLGQALQVDEHTGTELAKAQAPQQIAAAEPIVELEDGGQVDVEGEVHYSNPSEAAEKGEPAGWTQT